MEEDKNSKEINLLQLIELFFNWLKSLLQSVVSAIGGTLKLCYKYFWLSVAVVIIALCIGLYLSRPSARIYKVEAMAMLHGAKISTFKEVCKQLELSVPGDPQLSLAKKLSIPDSISNNIVSIETFYVIDFGKDKMADIIDFEGTHPLNDTVNVRMKDRLYIRIRTKNTSQIPQLQEGLLKYFENHLILKAQYQVARKTIVEQIAICDRGLQRIDSLEKISYFKNDNVQMMSFNKDEITVGGSKKQLFYKDLISLSDMKSWSEAALADKPVDFPSDFIVNPTAENNRLKYGIISIILGVFAALIIALFVDNYKRIMKYLKD